MDNMNIDQQIVINNYKTTIQQILVENKHYVLIGDQIYQEVQNNKLQLLLTIEKQNDLVPSIIELDNRLFYSDGKFVFKYYEHKQNKSKNISLQYNLSQQVYLQQFYSFKYIFMNNQLYKINQSFDSLERYKIPIIGSILYFNCNLFIYKQPKQIFSDTTLIYCLNLFNNQCYQINKPSSKYWHPQRINQLFQNDYSYGIILKEQVLDQIFDNHQLTIKYLQDIKQAKNKYIQTQLPYYLSSESSTELQTEWQQQNPFKQIN